MRFAHVLALLFMLFSIVGSCHAVNDMKPSAASIGRGYIPKAGFVPDEATAIKIALAVLTPIYGEEVLASERPFKATLRRDVWTVSGSIPTGHVGGAAEVRLSKTTGAILRVVHFK
jgi:hypothetical protein